MANREPVIEQSIATNGVKTVTPWTEASEQLEQASTYWRVTVRDGAYFADYGAPSAGPPPYELYKVQPATVFGLGTGEPYGATRWRFS